MPVNSYFVFLTLDNYSMIALGNALEVLRMANQLSESEAFQWRVASLDGKPTVASNGLTMQPTASIAEIDAADILFVCGGLHVEKYVSQPIIDVLLRFNRSQIALGSLCTGSYALAKAGLLDRCKTSIHWEYLKAMEKEFPVVQTCRQVYSIDQNRFTSSGGTAPLDLMLHIVSHKMGYDMSSKISAQFVLDRIRSGDDNQPIPVHLYHASSNGILCEIVELMEANVEEPLQMTDLARLAGTSQRQVERIFKRYARKKPSKYYLEIRLRHARRLLAETGMAVIEVSLACGFKSPQNFAKQYRQTFMHSPSQHRRLLRDATF